MFTGSGGAAKKKRATEIENPVCGAPVPNLKFAGFRLSPWFSVRQTGGRPEKSQSRQPERISSLRRTQLTAVIIDSRT